jgi:hypothetical protein
MVVALAASRPPGRRVVRCAAARLLSASVLHRYPLSARVLVFTAPALLLCCGAALAAIGERHGGAGRALAWATVLLLAAIDVTHPTVRRRRAKASRR